MREVTLLTVLISLVSWGGLIVRTEGPASDWGYWFTAVALFLWAIEEFMEGGGSG